MTEQSSTSLPVAVIPAYEPSFVVCEIVQELLEKRIFAHIVTVDDGSSAEAQPVFARLEEMEGVTVLRHAVNLGKGAALKTAFNHVLLRYPESIGVVTLDADGQHLARDVALICEKFREQPEALHLGVREFDSSTPLRSRFGNVMTRRVFKLFMGKDVTDTQTGLRGAPLALLPRLLRIPPNGYEFELEMLVRCVRDKVSVAQHPITTVYEPGNPTSHFNPLLDSFRIYFVFLRFSMVSILSFLLDTLLFGVLQLITGKLFLSLFVARCISGTFQFLCSKVIVFKSKGDIRREAMGYVALLMAIMLVSWVLIRGVVTYLGAPPLLAKILVETTLFLTSYTVQQNVVFARRNTEDAAYDTLR